MKVCIRVCINEYIHAYKRAYIPTCTHREDDRQADRQADTKYKRKRMHTYAHARAHTRRSSYSGWCVRAARCKRAPPRREACRRGRCSPAHASPAPATRRHLGEETPGVLIRHCRGSCRACQALAFVSKGVYLCRVLCRACLASGVCARQLDCRVQGPLLLAKTNRACAMVRCCRWARRMVVSLSAV